MANIDKLEVISSVEQALEYQKAWVNTIQLEPGYHIDVKEHFNDLNDIDAFNDFDDFDDLNAFNDLTILTLLTIF